MMMLRGRGKVGEKKNSNRGRSNKEAEFDVSDKVYVILRSAWRMKEHWGNTGTIIHTFVDAGLAGEKPAYSEEWSLVDSHICNSFCTFLIEDELPHDACEQRAITHSISPLIFPPLLHLYYHTKARFNPPLSPPFPLSSPHPPTS